MITTPDAKAVTDIVLIEAWHRPVDNAVQPVLTEIDKVLLLCNACKHGVCEIDYWIRDEENGTECLPQNPCCPKCPQWTCPPNQTVDTDLRACSRIGGLGNRAKR